MYEGGRVVPCVGDDLKEDSDNDDVTGKGKYRQDRSRSRGRSSSSGPSRSKSRARSTEKRKIPTDLFNQGLKDTWFLPNSTITPCGEQVRVVVEGAGDREYEAREEVLKGMRRGQGSVGDNADAWLRPTSIRSFVVDAPSVYWDPRCDHHGTTDTCHAEAWGDWAWQGRVRKWDGLVGIVRSGSVNPNTPPGAHSNRGKIFFYGTLLGLTNLFGTWRVTHEDPRTPAYEGRLRWGRRSKWRGGIRPNSRPKLKNFGNRIQIHMNDSE
ncbi:hypothetical protein BDP27DRAFT_1477840 [Rhodocollybia butyracea]|uniref:Uncharacterized protein n=1 Tax=Rhodocollybia butyracea TaxID=206335 RepID=A0A9P5U2M6_9AGAR|nr:hypothetical protein BDP27DRAFT_1477840 [Rhodocollybia butyracea]